jgi:hypothetical protein
VDAGQIKYLGQWLSKDEAIRRRIQIVAMEIYNTMQRQAAAGDFLGAMQTFAAIEKDYGTTRIYPAAVVLAQQVLVRFQQELANRIAAVKADQVQLQKTIDFTAEPEKSVIKAQAKAEDDRAAAAVNAAVQSGAKWVPLFPRSELSVNTLQNTAASEASRLASLPVSAMNASIAKVDAARTAIEAGHYTDADSLLKDASGLWATNEAAHYWSDRLAEKMATPTPRPATPTPKPTPTPRPTPPPVAVAAPVAAPAPEPETPFYMTFSGAMPIFAGLLIAVGLGANYVQKKKKKQQAAE